MQKKGLLLDARDVFLQWINSHKKDPIIREHYLQKTIEHIFLLIDPADQECCVLNIPSDKSNCKDKSKKFLPTVGYIFIRDWPKDAKHGWLGATALRNYVATCEELRSLAKKVDHSWSIKTIDVWEYFKNSKKGMYSRIKNKQKKVSHLWK